MIKKRNLLIVFFVLIALSYFTKNWYQSTYPKSTGAIEENPPEKEVELGDSIKKMKESLPILNDQFQIESYDYKTGKFNVKSATGSDISIEFEKWLMQSEYSSIPIKMFNFQI